MDLHVTWWHYALDRIEQVGTRIIQNIQNVTSGLKFEKCKVGSSKLGVQEIHVVNTSSERCKI